MHYHKELIHKIFLPDNLRRKIIDHCSRKADGIFLAGESPDRKAFGLIGGTVSGTCATVDTVIALKKNARGDCEHKQFMDEAMGQHAVPSETPLEKRGWVADREELEVALTLLRENGSSLIGSYHMHRVAWAHDPSRETPTTLDTVLAKDSRMFMFIVAVIDRSSPSIRAFYEGIPESEALIAAPSPST